MQTPRRASTTSLSVLVPVYNEQYLVAASLERLHVGRPTPTWIASRSSSLTTGPGKTSNDIGMVAAEVAGYSSCLRRKMG